MKNRLLLYVLGLWLALSAQGEVIVRHNSVPNPELFGLQLGAGQEMYCRVRAVNSVSLQSYLTPAFSVVEMVIDVINSPLQVRIYSTDALDPATVGSEVAEPVAEEVPIGVSALDFMRDGASQVTSPVLGRVDAIIDQVPVVKDYPLTTHSKTIEYKLPSADAVVALFNEFNGLWLQKPEAIEAMESSDAETQATGRINPLSRVIFVYQE